MCKIKCSCFKKKLFTSFGSASLGACKRIPLGLQGITALQFSTGQEINVGGYNPTTLKSVGKVEGMQDVFEHI
jgi:hypothetical protein